MLNVHTYCIENIASGNLLHNYGNLLEMVDFSNEHGGSVRSYIKLPEGHSKGPQSYISALHLSQQGFELDISKLRWVIYQLRN